MVSSIEAKAFSHSDRYSGSMLFVIHMTMTSLNEVGSNILIESEFSYDIMPHYHNNSYYHDKCTVLLQKIADVGCLSTESIITCV